MPTAAKAQKIDALAQLLSQSQLAILTDYRGLTVADLQTLRRTLRPLGAEFRIAKNTLTAIAAEHAGITGLDGMLEGPLAIAFVHEDVVGAAKALMDFARTSRILKIKGGIYAKHVISPAEVEELSTMPSREVLQARLLGMLASPMSRMVG
ncbi:MAG: 50S ribosomal protein L10, partial [Chloroflexota bacterium]